MEWHIVAEFLIFVAAAHERTIQLLQVPKRFGLITGKTLVGLSKEPLYQFLFVTGWTKFVNNCCVFGRLVLFELSVKLGRNHFLEYLLLTVNVQRIAYFQGYWVKDLLERWGVDSPVLLIEVKLLFEEVMKVRVSP